VPQWPSQTAYPPPRESCVRGADRAAVDKRFRLPICCASAASLFGGSGKLSTATFFAASPSSARAAASASARVMPPSNSMITARFVRASCSKSSSAATCVKKLGTRGDTGDTLISLGFLARSRGDTVGTRGDRLPAPCHRRRLPRHRLQPWFGRCHGPSPTPKHAATHAVAGAPPSCQPKRVLTPSFFILFSYHKQRRPPKEP